MKKSSLCLILFVSILLTTGCALAPLSSSFEGRSIGKGKVGLDVGGASIAGFYPTFKLTYGFATKMDVGFQYEEFSMGLFGKYSFINRPHQGFSLAGIISGGVTSNGNYFYIGPVLSYKSKTFEPYFVARLNAVHYNETKISSGITISEGKYSYLQLTGGSDLWLSPRIGLCLELSAFAGSTGSTEVEGAIIHGGLKLRF
ncbi:MAG: hypothetical protein OEZ45_08140 [Candidatus Aminicenantes bacterium]|nr:hypothetical protein [Candidatus Aminicenantes bacterium]